MANLTYRDNNVFQNLFDFRRDFDHIFNRFLSSGLQTGQEQQRGSMSMASFAPAVDAFIDRDGKRFVAHVALPGVDPKEVDISAQGNLLTISGERSVSDERREADTVYNELIYGAFERDFVAAGGRRYAEARRRLPQRRPRNHCADFSVGSAASDRNHGRKPAEADGGRQRVTAENPRGEKRKARSRKAPGFCVSE